MMERPRASPRRLACARCGTEFDCRLGGDCWCAQVPYLLRMTDALAAKAEDCLCPACLGKAAGTAATGI